MNEYEEALAIHGSERKAAQALGLTRSRFAAKLYQARGICPYCRKEPVEENKSRCRGCLDKADTRPKEVKQAYNTEYYWKNREKLKTYNKEYQKKNLEKFKNSRKKYDSTEAGQVSAAKRRAKRLSLQDTIMCSADLKYLKRKVKACESCGSKEALTLDHHIPLSKGGTLTLDNCNILCNVCNSSKRDSLPEDFFSPETLTKINNKFQDFQAYTRVISPKEYLAQKAQDVPACRSFIKKLHYSGTCPGGSFYFELLYQERLIGVAVFSKPSRQNITVEGVDKLLELSRFFVLDGTPKNTESYFLGKCLKALKKSEYQGVVSFADPTEGHTGVIYQASNFELVGITAKNYHYETKEGLRVHKRQVWDRAKARGVPEAQQATEESLEKVEEKPKYKYFRTL